METLKHLKDKLSPIHGGIFGILSLSIGILCDFLSYLYFPGYNMVDNMVSELGVGRGGIFFNIGVIITGILFIPFYICLGKSFSTENINPNMKKVAVIAALISSITFSLIGFFPLTEENRLINATHGTLAVIHWIHAFISIIIFGILMIQDFNYNRFQAYYSFAVGGIIITFFLTQIPLTEWIWTISIVIWIFVNSLFMLVHKYQ
ncbi:MAG: DUF998 domain-containing protein [Promethearchaeota archaeon]|nr:MAG: DUF998 domain-containing protein [Candidatus Lokiarchaeota archaeon]